MYNLSNILYSVNGKDLDRSKTTEKKLAWASHKKKRSRQTFVLQLFSSRIFSFIPFAFSITFFAVLPSLP